MPNPRRLTAVIEIGSTKICCFVARPEKNGWMVTGIGNKGSYGVRNGLVIDVDAAYKTVLAALHAAEKMADQAIEEVITLVNGVTPHVEILHAESAIKTQVSDEDIGRLQLQIMQETMREDKTLLHFLPHHYIIDSHVHTRDPRKMYGKNLHLEATCVWGDEAALRNVEAVVASCGLKHRRHVYAPLMGGYSTLIDQETAL
ncbi:MAG: cell division protein FtsA, partial [Pseudomonadota bacterium]